MTTTAVDLSKYDMELLIDKSGSMSTTDCKGKSRWDWAKEETLNIARTMSKYDSDGISVTVFGSEYKTYNNVNADKVEEIFKENSPGGGTETASALESRLQAYRERHAAGNAKPVIFAVITDGEPADRNAVKSAIVSHTKWMTADEQTGITFMQVGNDAGATNFLKELDDNLEGQGAKYDIVDTKSFTEIEKIGVEQALVASISD